MSSTVRRMTSRFVRVDVGDVLDVLREARFDVIEAHLGVPAQVIGGAGAVVGVFERFLRLVLDAFQSCPVAALRGAGNEDDEEQQAKRSPRRWRCRAGYRSVRAYILLFLVFFGKFFKAFPEGGSLVLCHPHGAVREQQMQDVPHLVRGDAGIQRIPSVHGKLCKGAGARPSLFIFVRMPCHLTTVGAGERSSRQAEKSACLSAKSFSRSA